MTDLPTNPEEWDPYLGKYVKAASEALALMQLVREYGNAGGDVTSSAELHAEIKGQALDIVEFVVGHFDEVWGWAQGYYEACADWDEGGMGWDDE